MMTNFFSNRMNLWGLLAVSYLIVGYVCMAVGLTTTQILIVCSVVGVGNFTTYLFGYSRGIIFTTSQRPKFIQELNKINEMIRKENKKPSKKKCKMKVSKDEGCASGGCKNC